MTTPRTAAQLAPLLLALTSCAAIQERLPGGGDLTSTAHVSIGHRYLWAAESNCLDEHTNLGFGLATWREDGLFGYELEVAHHADEGDVPSTGETTWRGWSVSTGLRRVWPIEGWGLTPYAGVGVDAYWADRDNEFPPSDAHDEVGAGLYGRIGVTTPLTENAFVGLDLRLVQEELLGGDEYDLDGHVVSIVLGLTY